MTRRAGDGAATILRHGALTIDPRSRRVTWEDAEVALTRREFDLLHELLRQRGRVLTREQLEASLYGWQQDVDSNAIEVHVHKLRRKLARDLIRNVRGVGYCIER